MTTAIACVAALAIFSFCVAEEKFIKGVTIYKISNKADEGVLTATPDDLKVQLKPWEDDAGQKWKSKLPVFAKSFEFKPTSDESITLDADALNEVYARSAPGSDAKYWYVKDMGEDTFQMKNYETSTCLTSTGLNKTLKLAECDNSRPQQWIFTEL